MKGDPVHGVVHSARLLNLTSKASLGESPETTKVMELDRRDGDRPGTTVDRQHEGAGHRRLLDGGALGGAGGVGRTAEAGDEHGETERSTTMNAALVAERLIRIPPSSRTLNHRMVAVVHVEAARMGRSQRAERPGAPVQRYDDRSMASTGNVPPVLLAMAVVAMITVIGIGLTTLVDVPLRPEERLAIGVVVGVVADRQRGDPHVPAHRDGPGTLAAALIVPGVPAGVALGRNLDVLRRAVADAGRRLRLPSRQAASLRPLAALTLIGGAVTTRILSLAYQHTPDGISAGSLAIWGDWSAHLAYAGSFAYGDNRALETPLAAGSPLKYHYFANFTGALFTETGLALTEALVVSAWVMAIVFPIVLFTAMQRLSGSRLTAGLTVVFFILTGGVGVWYFLVDVRANGWDILAALPQTYARMPDQHLWVDNTISASLYAQRSTLYGLTMGAAALTLLLASRPAWRRGGFVLAGLLVGVTGIVHVHLLATGLALGGIAWLFDRRRTWWWFLVPATVLGLPLTAAIRPPQDATRWLVGWMAPDADQSWLWFWFRNVGLLLPVFLVVVLFGLAPTRLRRLTMPLWLWFVVPNLLAFHPGEWNNTKFFLFWQLAGCLAIAGAISRALHVAARRPGSVRTIAFAGAAVLVAALTVTGGLDTVRAMQRSSAIPWVEDDEVAAASWLRANARPGDRLVYGAHNTSAVAALGGVPAVSGYPGWTNDLGLPDWADRWGASRVMLAGEPEATDLLDQYGVDWVVIGPRERFDMGASDAFWDENAELAFLQGEYRIYRVRP